MKLLTTIGAAAALALALGFAGAPAMAQGAPDMPAPDAGPAPGATEPGGPGDAGGPSAMPLPEERGMMPGEGTEAPADLAEPGQGDQPATRGAQREDPAAPSGEAGDTGKAGETETEDRDSAAGMEEGDRKAGAEVEGRTRTGAEVEVDRDKTGTAETDMKEGDRDKAGTAEVEKSGEGKAAVKIEPEQKTKITSYFKENKPDVKIVDKSSVSVSIGVVVPASISLHPLPADIIVVAGDCSLLFFLWGPDLVLVDSCTRHVVDIIPGIA